MKYWVRNAEQGWAQWRKITSQRWAWFGAEMCASQAIHNSPKILPLGKQPDIKSSPREINAGMEHEAWKHSPFITPNVICDIIPSVKIIKRLLAPDEDDLNKNDVKRSYKEWFASKHDVLFATKTSSEIQPLAQQWPFPPSIGDIMVRMQLSHSRCSLQMHCMSWVKNEWDRKKQHANHSVHSLMMYIRDAEIPIKCCLVAFFVAPAIWIVLI